MRVFNLILALALCSCAEPSRPAIVDENQALERQWLLEYEKELSYLESSYPATQYAAALEIDLSKVRALLREGRIAVHSHPQAEYLLDHRGDRVHAKEVSGNYEIAGRFWRRFFEEQGARESSLLIHEILRLFKDSRGHARDNDGRDSRALARLASATRVIPSASIPGKIQVGTGCTAETITAQREGKHLKILLSGSNSSPDSKARLRTPIIEVRRHCEVRIPALTDVTPSVVKAVSRARSNTIFWGEISVTIQGKQAHHFSHAAEYGNVKEMTETVLKAPSLIASEPSGVTIVKVETRATSNHRAILEPNVLEIEFE